ncbi:Oidioi.mRNA.OKI2018_I69.chr2.g5781.t1.cds [Oikopleura dioica]|uniref:Oidioi.mRNA.OKI2018_I69.chr2.g5781.t1.cds n=1 Tax=Oikopleura dioica TaxID=34765 RepID=A0ABN7T342_OIKDI|nr:Oidioi.mRNA.OKI2018_I69.chr2.g5781.t1.cds [Oikopleura dioica]
MEQFFRSLLETNRLSSLTQRIVQDRYKAEINNDKEMTANQSDRLISVVVEMTKAEREKKFEGIDRIKLEEARKIIDERIDTLTRKLDQTAEIDGRTSNRLKGFWIIRDFFLLFESKLEDDEYNNTAWLQKAARFLIETAKEIEGFRERGAELDREEARLDEEVARRGRKAAQMRIVTADISRLQAVFYHYFMQIFRIPLDAPDRQEQIERLLELTDKIGEEVDKRLDEYDAQFNVQST